ncbi:helix-turn-helix domain-containing protein [Deinococcus indicus]|uniref:helix-turn-helix domain-containing protein n=1 Tax=Deinococcus indicus TaxID=223556 RepID=UPI001FD30547|nr:helix-turn-helix domain-containing protein [Deinococcus indicus]
MLKAFRYRLCPTKAQEAALNEQLRLCRNPYNSALQERRDACRKAGKTVTEYGQMKYLTEVNARRCLIRMPFVPPTIRNFTAPADSTSGICFSPPRIHSNLAGFAAHSIGVRMKSRRIYPLVSHLHRRGICP